MVDRYLCKGRFKTHLDAGDPSNDQLRITGRASRGYLVKAETSDSQNGQLNMPLSADD